MKKVLTIGILSSLFIFACAGEDTENIDGEAEVVEVIEPVPETDVDEAPEANGLEQQAGHVIEADSGTRTIIAQEGNIAETQESGPFEVTLLHAQLSQFQPAEGFVEIYGGDDLVLVSFQVEVTNTSEDTSTIYPDQGIVVTDTGEEVHAEVFLSDQVGGEFFGEVTKAGDVFFLYDGDAKEVSNVRYIIEGPHNMNFEDIGEDIEFTVDFNE